ncbi:protease complex subunit PrcB family protein [Alkaliphilus sp. B6464]|uniref:protease complex subunit PrcB family protein n=1 Tax=Alkaliphilus sp. B6464 TaxID=2731219 RepID=UPI001BA4CD84|nr:protease complex subunit PrcB family protein [Alkaliphilus sp. B6464]QUH22072.1 protease complex subunit PrcB family protein [Alkaliphilus sp. B6464]
MNKKLVAVGAISLLSLSILVGCSTGKTPTDSKVDDNKQVEQNPSEQQTGITDITKKIEIVSDVTVLPKEVQDSISQMSKEKGYTFFELENNEYVVAIASGEKDSGGYDIKVEKAEEKTGIVEITVKETAPDKDAVVTEVITYPVTVFKIKDMTAAFEVKNTEGETFDYILIDQQVIPNEQETSEEIQAKEDKSN